MKSNFKVKLASAILLVISVLFFFTGSILMGFVGSFATFQVTPLASAFRDFGLLSAVLSGFVLVATVIVDVVKNAINSNKKDGE